MSQLALRYADKWRGSETWLAMLEEMRAITAAVGLKQAAYDLDVQPSVLAHALAERDGHKPKAEWIPYFVHKASTNVLVSLLADMRGLELQHKRELTPQEKLDRLNAELDRNPAVGAAIRKAAGL